MWVFTIDGFYSVVQHHDDPAMLLVRARVRQDLVALTQLMAATGDSLVIEATPDRDYAYRTTVPRGFWERYLVEASERIDYGNFKSEVAARLGHDRADIYLDVWATMLDLQRGEQ